MKRLIAAAVLLTVVIVCFFSGYAYIKSICETSNKLLDECINEFKSTGVATSQAEKLAEFWSEKENTLSIFANHTTVDEIESAIGTLKVYSSTNETEHFYEHSSAVRTLLHQLLEDTKPNMHSVL